MLLIAEDEVCEAPEAVRDVNRLQTPSLVYKMHFFFTELCIL